MPRASADKSSPPPLRALGGWPYADWFDPSILDQSEVVGISLPPLAGIRKQRFELAERLAWPTARRKTASGRAASAPDNAPSGIAGIIEGTGAVRAASFRRPKFFFDAAPTLFFAEVPASHLKIRSADTLRRNLIANASRGCVLSCHTISVTVMLWPSHEVEITAFVVAAAPPHPTHVQFDLADEERLSDTNHRKRLGKADAAGGRATERAAPSRGPEDGAERARLIAELDGLRARIVELQRKQSVQGAMEMLGLDDARLKAMLLLLHPDRHGNSAAANEAAKWVNGLRDVLKTQRTS